MRKKTESQLKVEKEIAEFESKHGSDVAFKWSGKWVKKKDVRNVAVRKQHK